MEAVNPGIMKLQHLYTSGFDERDGIKLLIFHENYSMRIGIHPRHYKRSQCGYCSKYRIWGIKMKIINVLLILLTLIVTTCEAQAGENITFTTTGSTFAPIIEVTGKPEILWVFGDGSTSTSTAPEVDFGLAAVRTNTLVVTPWSAVTEINLGYAGEDGGVAPGHDTILGHPQQNVIAVYGLENVNQSLQTWASCDNPIRSLNFNNFTKLTTVECFWCTSLKNITLENVPSLKRLCVEACDLTAIDLSGAPQLADLRLANQDNLLAINWSKTVNNWHICCHSNPALTTVIPVDRCPQLKELMMQNTNQSGEFHPCSAELRAVYANDNRFTSANLFGCFPEGHSATVRLQNNALASINISADPGIYSLNLENNSLNQTAVDNILQVLDSYGTSHRILNLASNAAPSAAGIASACNLLNRSWTVTVEPPTDIIILNEATHIAPDGTTMRAGTKARTLADIHSTLVNTPSDRVLNNVSIIPTSGEIEITVTQWESTKKVWSESSETPEVSIRHIIGDFPANTEIQILRNGIAYKVAVSNETGYIDWTYTGGYGEYNFEAVAGDEVPQTDTGNAGPTSISENTENAWILPVSSSNFSNSCNNNTGTVNCGYTPAPVTIVALGTAGIMISRLRLRE